MFSLVKIEKLKKFLIISLIAISTIFISGFSNSYAYSGTALDVQDFVSSVEKAKNDYKYWVCFQKDAVDDGNISDAVQYFIFANHEIIVSGGRTYYGSGSILKVYYLQFFERYYNGKVVANGALYGETSSLDLVEGQSIVAANHDVKNLDGDILFQKRLVEEVNQLIPMVTEDSQTIVIVGASLISLVVCLTLLRKAFPIFLRR